MTKAVVIMKIDVLVEVDVNEDYYVMLEQAERSLSKHVVAGLGFFPFRHEVNIVEEGTTVDELIKKLTVQPGTGWNDC